MFQKLYENHEGAADSMAQVWKFVASQFKQFPNILGYNILNEPWAGTGLNETDFNPTTDGIVCVCALT